MTRIAPLLILLAPLMTGCVFANVDLQPDRKPYTQTIIASGNDAMVAVIDVSGVITDHADERPLFGQPPESLTRRILDQLELAANNEDVCAVVLKVDSPGGTVTASDIIHRELLRFRAESKKPVVACFMDTAASGGYYIATAANSIVAHPTTVTGSIGVIMQGFDLSGLLEKIGVAVEPVKSGPKKDIGSPFRARSPEEEKVLQDIIDEMYQGFLAKVREGRPGISEATLKEYTDGRVFTGTVAKRAGFVDEIGYVDDAVRIAGNLAGVANPAAVSFHRENEAPGRLYAAAERMSPAALFDAGLLRRFGVLEPGFYYIWLPAPR